MAYLVLHPGTQRENRVEINDDHFVIGRSESCDLELHDLSVSDRHAKIEKIAGGYLLVDLGSTNGTEVNGELVSGQLLADQDQLAFGEVPAVFALAEAQTGDEAALPVKAEPVALQHREVAMAHRQANGMAPVAMHPPSGVGALPLLAFLAAVSVIGFPLGLALGVMAYVRMNAYGGTRHDKRLTNWALALSMAWLMLSIAGVAHLVRSGKEGKQEEVARSRMNQNELAVIRSLKGLACAQKYVHTIEFKDSDRDGDPEFLALDELAAAGTAYFDEDLSDGAAHGYRYFMSDLGENQFTAVAEPMQYGVDGTRTFSVDQTGQVRADDLEGERIAEGDRALTIMQSERSAFYETDNEIARDVINYTKQISVSGADFEQVSRILDRLRDRFAMTDAGQELLGVRDTTDLFLLEKRAQEKFDRAQEHIASGEPLAAISLLKDVVDNHERYSRHRESIELLSSLEAEERRKDEDEADALMERADSLERTGQQGDAQDLYRRIEKHYEETDAGLRVSELKGDFDRQVREKRAQELFFELMELNPRQEADRILGLADQLNRNYSDTDLMYMNYDNVVHHTRKARAEKWRIQTRTDITQGRTRGALARLEAAAEENPDIRYDLKDLLVELYEKVAPRLIEEGDDREAFRIYSELYALTQGTEQESVIDRKVLAELSYKIGYSEFERGRYKDAGWYLANAAWYYQKDPQFNLRFGVAHLYQGKYATSLASLSRAVKLENTLVKAYLYRSYLLLREALYLEGIVARALGASVGSGGDPFALDEDETSELAPGEETSPGEERLSSLNLANMFQATAQDVSDSPVPDPVDLNIDFSYDYDKSSAVLPEIIELIRELFSAKPQFADALNEMRGAGAGKVDDERIRQYVVLTDYRNRTSELTILAKRDVEARQAFSSTLIRIQRRLAGAGSDLRQVVKIEPQLTPIVRDLLRDMVKKEDLVSKAADAIVENNRREVRMQEQALDYAQRLLTELQKQTPRSMRASFMGFELASRAGSRNDLEEGLLALEEAVQVQMDLEEIRRSAEHGLVQPKPVQPEAAAVF